MSSAAKPDADRTAEQIEKDTADRIEAAVLHRRIQQAAAWRDTLRAGERFAPTKILSQN